MISTEDLYHHFKSCGLVCTDTRNIMQGSMFFALKGANFNGNLFAARALENGAAYAVVDEEIGVTDSKILRVENVLTSLQDLARYHRRQFSIPVIAVTGSNGKTTTKELLNAVLNKKYKTLATKGNLNNHIGVPLTLLELKDIHEIAVIEMGANHQNEIAALCRIAEPSIGVITNIGKAHLEGFGGIEGVIKAKSEMYDFLQIGERLSFVNADDELLMQKSAQNNRILYGTGQDVQLRGKKESVFPFVSFSFSWRHNHEKTFSHIIHSNLSGDFHLSNLLCAAAVGCYLGLTAEQIKAGIEAYEPSNQRSQWVQAGSARILLDTYNANPGSVSAAIKLINDIPSKGEKLLILGDMFELGNESFFEHSAILREISEIQGIRAFVLGQEFSKAYQADAERYKNILSFTEREALFSEIKKTDRENLTVLLKGSRGMKMEEFLPAIS
jgi:UDP-N-acetylmuramoyl-tripeptide--D-alanyl-D-alanine ligase